MLGWKCTQITPGGGGGGGGSWALQATLTYIHLPFASFVDYRSRSLALAEGSRGPRAALPGAIPISRSSGKRADATTKKYLGGGGGSYQRWMT